MIHLGNKIRELRKKNGLTQEQLANALNVTPQAVSKWEMGAGYPDVATLPVLAGYFQVSLDAMFDYDPEEVENKIMEVLYNSRVDERGFRRNFEEQEKILLDGIQKYPGGFILKKELLELYMGTSAEHDEKAMDMAKQLIAECKDSFIYLGAMEDLAYMYLHADRYEDAKRVVEAMPYRYNLDLCDRMRTTARVLNCKDRIHEVRELKRWEHQDFYMTCQNEGHCFFELGDYENALLSFEEAADLLERFCRRPVPREYEMLQDADISQGITRIQVAAALWKLGRTDECDAMLGKAYRLIRDCWTDEEWERWGHRYLENDYRGCYTKMGLDEYKPCPY